MPQCSQLPARAGVGLKPEHYAALLDACRGGGDFLGDWCPQWVEVHPQNYFCKGGPPHRWLTEVASEMPLSFHSTALSLGSADGPDDAELDQLAALVSRYQPASISDHLSWSNTGPSGAGGEKFPDLLPVPYTRAALAILQRNVDMVQNRLARRILIENPSRYLSFADDEMDEVDFIGQLCAETGCGLLLDINNIEVSATNLGFNASAYLARIDPALVGEIHLAGHSTEFYSDGSMLKVDDHGSPVSEICWGLYQRFIARSGPLPTLLERDTRVPSFTELAAEAARADQLMEAAHD